MNLIKKIITASLVVVSISASQAMEEDKAKHLAVSAGLGFAANTVFDSHEVALASCMGVGLAKELYDEYSYGGFDGRDFVMDSLGCALGVVSSECIGLKIGVGKQNDAHMVTLQYDF